jgi:hypothetical protein
MSDKNISALILVKQLQADILRLLSYLEVTTLDRREQLALGQFKNDLTDAKLDIQDYENAETRDEQAQHSKDAKERLVRVHSLISSNTLHVFGAVDVAHLTAQIGQINDRLR